MVKMASPTACLGKGQDEGDPSILFTLSMWNGTPPTKANIREQQQPFPSLNDGANSIVVDHLVAASIAVQGWWPWVEWHCCCCWWGWGWHCCCWWWGGGWHCCCCWWWCCYCCCCCCRRCCCCCQHVQLFSCLTYATNRICARILSVIVSVGLLVPLPTLLFFFLPCPSKDQPS